MPDTIQQIAEDLSTMDDVNGVHDMAEHRISQGDAAFVADLGIALFKRYGAKNRLIWQYRSVLDSVLRLLTVAAGPEHVEQTLRLLDVTSADDRTQARYPASLLASNRTPEELAAVFAGWRPQAHGSEELRACLLHELVLRDAVIGNTPEIAAWATSPHWSRHPLRWLPLAPSPVEKERRLPGQSVHSFRSRFLSSSDEPVIAPAPERDVPSAREIDAPRVTETIASAVANWAEESNGLIEARSYELDAPAGPVADLLVSLNLECLDGLDREATPSVSPCPPSRAWQVLFTAASEGGTYNDGLYGAYGRLATWKSLAGLAGAAEERTFAEVKELVQNSRWHTFGTTTKWFDQSSWDIGMAALGPNDRVLGVLAATDTN